MEQQSPKYQLQPKDVYLTPQDKMNACYNQMPTQIQFNFPSFVSYVFYCNPQYEICSINYEQRELIFQNDQEQGRGGNNVAENIKKSIFSTLKKHLSRQNYEYFTKAFVRKYSIKSQKENYILIFLFLHLMAIKNLINFYQVGQIIAEVRGNIQSYINHSMSKSLIERTNFHHKNAQQFSKFYSIDIDFTKKRSFKEIEENITSLFLRKKRLAYEATVKVQNIVNSLEQLKAIFFEVQSISCKSEEYKVKQQEQF